MRAAEAAPLSQRAQTILAPTQAALAARLQEMGLQALPTPARDWWQAFIEENAAMPEVMLTLLDELRQRDATLEAFAQAYFCTDAETVHEVLEQLDRPQADPSPPTGPSLTPGLAI